MKAIFAPAIAVCGRLRNIVKLPLIGLLFTIPLAVALWVSPQPWAAPGTWVIVGTYVFAWYFMAGHLLAHDDTWDLINRMARKLGEHDLREDRELSKETVAQKFGAGQFKRLYDTLADTQENLRLLVQQARSSAQTTRFPRERHHRASAQRCQACRQAAGDDQEVCEPPPL